MGPADGRALGDGVSPHRRPAAASEPDLRGDAGRPRAVHPALHPDPARRAEAAGADPRRLRASLQPRPQLLRILPRARRAARFPLGQHDHGHAALDSAGAGWHYPDRLRAEAKTRAGVMANETPPLEAEIRRLITIAGPMPLAEYM